MEPTGSHSIAQSRCRSHAPARSRPMRSLILLGALGLLLLIALFVGLRGWTGLAGVEMPWQGWLALIGGVVLTLALGVGLMTLMFYSARRGHDEAAHDQQAFRLPESRDEGDERKDEGDEPRR